MLRTKYPAIEPNKTGFLQVDAEHSVYWEESGNPQGKPILFLHGGPGAGTEPGHRQFFDPKHYRIILIDQRGAGRSEPHASLNNNSTWHLVSDIELLRNKLNIDKWIVFGGSWGSTLSLAYAIKHPERVKALVLRGIFLCRQEEIEWFYQKGAHMVYADYWEDYLKPIPESERKDLVTAYYKRLTSQDSKVRAEACRAWSGWEGRAIKLIPDPATINTFDSDFFAESLARIECHYFVNKAFFESDNWLLENAHRIQDIPGYIVHGRYDMCTPFKNAWDLHKVWSKGKLVIVGDAGHAASEPGITDALVTATDELRSL